MDIDATSDDKNQIISLTEVAELYGFERRYLAKLAQKQRLKARKVGKMWVTTLQDVESYISSREKRGVYRSDIQIVDK